MATLVMDCPHCGVKNVNLGVVANADRPLHSEEVTVLAHCTACDNPVCAVFKTTAQFRGKHSSIKGYPGNLFTAPDLTKRAVYPFPQAVDVPEDVPENVGRVFKQAVESFRAGHLDAACGMYRRAMELGLKTFSPDIEAWKLEKRIDRMAAENKITVELKDWAHELRLDGNDALHGDGEATPEMAEQMHELCRFLLIYLYTLPNQVQRAKARRAAGQ